MISSMLLKAAPYAIVSAIAVGAYHNLPIIGPGARIHRLDADRDAWRAKADEWIRYGRAEKKTFDVSEGFRRREQRQAVSALTDEARACDARVARARASAAAIRNIVTREVPHDPSGCPVRALVDPGELRDAVAPSGRR